MSWSWSRGRSRVWRILKHNHRRWHELLQLKATDSMSYSAFERWMMLRSTSSEHLTTSWRFLRRTQMDEISESVVVDLLNKGAEMAFDSIPFVSMVTTGVIEGQNYLTGRFALRESLRRGAKRVGQAAVYDAIGTTLGPVGVPVVVSLRAAHMRIASRIALGDHLESRTMEIRLLNLRC